MHIAAGVAGATIAWLTSYGTSYGLIEDGNNHLPPYKEVVQDPIKIRNDYFESKYEPMSLNLFSFIEERSYRGLGDRKDWVKFTWKDNIKRGEPLSMTFTDKAIAELTKEEPPWWWEIPREELTKIKDIIISSTMNPSGEQYFLEERKNIEIGDYLMCYFESRIVSPYCFNTADEFLFWTALGSLLFKEKISTSYVWGVVELMVKLTCEINHYGWECKHSLHKYNHNWVQYTERKQRLQPLVDQFHNFTRFDKNSNDSKLMLVLHRNLSDLYHSDAIRISTTGYFKDFFNHRFHLIDKYNVYHDAHLHYKEAAYLDFRALERKIKSKHTIWIDPEKEESEKDPVDHIFDEEIAKIIKERQEYNRRQESLKNNYSSIAVISILTAVAFILLSKK